MDGVASPASLMYPPDMDHRIVDGSMPPRLRNVSAPHPSVVPTPFARGSSLRLAFCASAEQRVPPPPNPIAGRRTGNPNRRRTTAMRCEAPMCRRYREGTTCHKCAVHCRQEDNPTCEVHWAFPLRCLYTGGRCVNLHPEECVVNMCAMRCRAENCDRHKHPPLRREDGSSAPRTRGMRSHAQWRHRVVSTCAGSSTPSVATWLGM